MNEEIRQLSPNKLWNYFADLNAIPRASKKEQRVIAFMKAFGENLKLETKTDEAGNVIIRKPGTKSMENRQTIALQSHLDMVHQKNNDTTFNFDEQGIEMYIDGDWVKAKGTTLGADNGIGVAAIMTLLASNDIPHPTIEALFTVDEETGMTGASSFKGGLLNGNMLLNLDTEKDDELTIGCAGGIDVTATGSYKQKNTTQESSLQITVKGLTGGHSGVDIHLGRGNANKLMNRILLKLTQEYNISIAEIDGGDLRNAIPRESVAIIVVGTNHATALKETITQIAETLQKEHQTTDTNLTITIKSANLPAYVMERSFQQKLLRAIYTCPNSIYRMNSEINGLVQSSNNISRVLVKDGSYSIQCLTRSSIETEKEDLKNAITSAFELIDASVDYAGGYPGWEPKPDAPIVKLMSNIYQEMFNAPAHINAVHAGLECGILGTTYPNMQMISFGPNINGAHSPDECVQISSVQKFWSYLLEVLRQIPVKN